MHGPRITVPYFHPLDVLTIDELRHEASDLLMLAHHANGMGDIAGAALVIGRGFRLDRELHLRRARLREDGP